MQRTILVLPQQRQPRLCLPQSLIDATEGFHLQLLPLDASAEQRHQAIAAAEIIIGEPTLSELALAEKLQWLQLTWSGADRYTLHGFPKEVRLTTAAGAFGETVAEHGMAMLLALCRRLPIYIKSNEWHDFGSEKALLGATALLYGAGDIGSQLARRLKAFGVRVIGVCKGPKPPRPYFDALTTLPLAEAFLPEADFIIGALPQTPQTGNYFSLERLSLCKHGAVFINVGRGSFVDTDALCVALQDGTLFGAGLDVFEEEPLPTSHPLRSFANVILTPHVAGVSFGHLPHTEQRIWQLCAENLRRYQNNLPLNNEVLFP